jgi:salicylate hydroxylase
VIHRADVHLALLEGARASGQIEVLTSTAVSQVVQCDSEVTVIDGQGGIAAAR